MMAGTPLRLKKSDKADAAAAGAPTIAPLHRDWRVLVVDDDRDVHAVTRMALGKVRFNDRGIALLSAHSAVEAEALLRDERDIAVILLDVVMETDDAGLRLVRFIREEMKNVAVRIILRTGQPGQAPEEEVIVDYDINGYKAKSELTSRKLFTAVVSALRAYDTIVALDKNRRGLEKILDASSRLHEVGSIHEFASGVLTQLSAFLGCKPNGVICVHRDVGAEPDEVNSLGDLSVLASTGEYASCGACALDGDCRHTELVSLVRLALSERRNQYAEDHTVLFLDSGAARATVALVHGTAREMDASDQRLLEIFAAKISIALANALHYQRMISAEVAAVTDFLTGLNNRRHLLRLGVPLAAAAHRAGAPLAVALIDIDHFKRINDTLGHDGGDVVLQRVSEVLAGRFSGSDVVARFGGEEFCVIATNAAPDEAFDLFDGLRRTLAAWRFDVGGTEISVTVSIGVTTRVSDNIDTMISAADDLLYAAKSGGRDRVEMD